MNILYVNDPQGRPIAVQIPFEEWEALQQLVDEVVDLGIAKQRLDDPESKWIDHDEARRRLGLDD